MANNSTSCESVDQLIVYTVPAKVVFGLFYSLIFVVGIVGNVLVAAAVARRPKMRTVTNLFILNLAVSDVVMCLFSVPITPIHSFTGDWVFGHALCVLLPFSVGVSVYVSTLTLTVIAVDRFVVIVFPFRARMQTKACLLLICLIDVTAAACTAPYALHMDTAPAGDDGGNATQCVETWSGSRRTAYGAFTNVTQFALPFATIVFCYAAVMRRLSARQRAAKPGRRSARGEEAERRRATRTNRMLIAMVVVFGVCWLPLNAVNFVADVGAVAVHCWHYHHLAFFACHVLAMSSTCYNPFLYGWLNESFRVEFVAMLPALRVVCVGGDEAGAGTTGAVRSSPRDMTTRVCSGRRDDVSEAVAVNENGERSRRSN